MRNQYLIGGWYTPPCSKEQFRLFRECGLNTIFLVNNELPEEAELRRDWRERALSFCDDCGIFAYIQPDKGMTPRESAEIIAPFRSHPSFRGYIAFDEPSRGDFSVLRKISRIHSDIFPRQNCFVNLLPTYGSEESFGDSYRGYVEEYVTILKNTCGEKWLSFDFYPVLDSSECGYLIAETWLENIEIVAETAKRNGVPFNAFIQAMPYSARLHNRIPSYADLSLQVYTYLAYGARGVTYFCYGTPPVDSEFSEEQEALIDRSGAPTELYAKVKKLNAEIFGFLPGLSEMQYDFTWILGEYKGFEKLSRVSPRARGIERVTADGACLCGVYEKEKVTGMILVNYGETTLESEKTVKIRLDAPRNVICMQAGVRSETYTAMLELRLNAGEGCFIQVN